MLQNAYCTYELYIPVDYPYKEELSLEFHPNGIFQLTSIPFHKVAYKAGYFNENTTELLASRTNKKFHTKEILTADEYKMLLNTSCKNYEIQNAFIFSL